MNLLNAVFHGLDGLMVLSDECLVLAVLRVLPQGFSVISEVSVRLIQDPFESVQEEFSLEWFSPLLDLPGLAGVCNYFYFPLLLICILWFVP